MKKNIIISIIFISFLPLLANAATVGSFIDNITNVFIGIIPVLLGLAVVMFFWGLVKFINHADDEKAVAEGKMLMVYGMMAIFVMVALWGIIGYMQTQLDIGSSIGLGNLRTMPNGIP